MTILLMNIFRSRIPSSPFPLNIDQDPGWMRLHVVSSLSFPYAMRYLYELKWLEENYQRPQHLPHPLSQIPINS